MGRIIWSFVINDASPWFRGFDKWVYTPQMRYVNTKPAEEGTIPSQCVVRSFCIYFREFECDCVCVCVYLCVCDWRHRQNESSDRRRRYKYRVLFL